MNCLSNFVDPVGYQLAASIFCLLVITLVVVIGLLVWLQGSTWNPSAEELRDSE